MVSTIESPIIATVYNFFAEKGLTCSGSTKLNSLRTAGVGVEDVNEGAGVKVGVDEIGFKELTPSAWLEIGEA